MKDPKLYNLFRDTVKTIFPMLEIALNQAWLKRTHEYPYVSYKDNGMPSITKHSYNSPAKIADLFEASGGTPSIDIKNIKEYNELVNYLITNEKHREVSMPTNFPDENLFNIVTELFIKEVIERFYHLNKDNNFNNDVFDRIYIETENFMYAEKLSFDISVPILFLCFDFDEIEIDKNCSVRRISENNHKARFNIRSYSPPISDSVISSATHEVVFKDYYIQKGVRLLNNTLSNENAYPIELFESFFNAIKIVTNHSSGFSQILVHPYNWADRYHIDLPLIHGISIRKYPAHFDNYYWTNEIFPILNENDLKSIASVFSSLSATSNNKIKIANKRLRSSYLRDNEDDSILDIIIALEMLLSDEEKGEITHKLALRVAKLISVYNENYDSVQVFEAVKKIYAFRSALVHGSTKSNSKREIKLHDAANPINSISLANDFLREIIRIILEHPEFLDAKEIDRLLLS